MKSKYKIYPFIKQKQAKILRKGDKKFKKKSDWESMAYLYNAYPALCNEIEFNILAEEYFWERAGRQALFIQSADDASRFITSRYSLKMMTESILPFSSFMMCLPSDFNVDGLSCSGVLVSAIKTRDVKTELFDPLCNKLNMPPSKVKTETDSESVLLMLVYKIEGDSAYSRALIDSNKLETIANTASLDEYKENVGKYGENYIFTSESDDPKEHKLQQTLIRLILGVSIYLKAKPESLTPGYPSKNKMVFEGGLFDKQNSPFYPSLAKRDGTSPVAHTRSWFIRQLIHDRYYQNEYKSRPRGSRFVFVDETTVNLKVNPKHIED